MFAIPLDLIVEILCQLPVKSLLRFRCLSKEFRSMIDDRDFIRRHHNACLQTNSNRRIIARNNEGTTLFSLEFDSTTNVIAAAKILDVPIQNLRFGFPVIGSCHGLLALSPMDHQGHITAVLWNISTNKLRILPRIRGDSGDLFGCFGFGYDLASDDYKLVKIFGNQSSTKVIVYSLRADSWRWIEDLPDYCYFYSFHQQRGTLVAGTLNWMGQMEIESRESRVLIISFDLKSENFRNVPIPDITNTNLGKLGIYDINDLGGCLCLSCIDGCEQVVDIWVMKEYNVKDSWTKLFSFSYLLTNIYVIRHDLKKGKDEIVEAIRHDLKRGKDEIVEVEKWPYIFSVTIYVDSLVSL
ncbi:hypothetical protein JRO89_XS07G0279100 [Xanthoceras sorbifolium]|uniref:F-box domain-containing protein n=1 Tax=Xanthoceras sorbifolium TaxID=99658 RepID=A0ABQ8HVF6_9ROSI|nr:hypothetical protein JRO89_XS07G0279100 [Xanthoceras sorbifolium]